jgi:hypothetical protein
MRQGASRSPEDCVSSEDCISFEGSTAIEYRIVSRVLFGRDLSEGEGAVIIDTDDAPVWRPRSLTLAGSEA